MTTSDRRLLRHLVIVVLIKLALLGGLWWAFFRGAPQAPNDTLTPTSHGESK